MPKYPYPIVADWTEAGAYPQPSELDLEQWAWEFLRRNPEYQRLYDWFDSLPNNWTLADGSLSNKNGKWKGTPPAELRFFEDGACWYADPLPKPGESEDEWIDRTGGGEIMPFAHYLCWRFHVEPHPRDPRLPFYIAAS